MSFKYWSSPFSIVSSLREELTSAGLDHQPWQSVDAIDLNQLLILFDPPDLILSNYANNQSQSNQTDFNLIDLPGRYSEIISVLSKAPCAIVAAWQLLDISYSVSLREILRSDRLSLSSHSQAVTPYPIIDTLCGLGVQYLDRKLCGKISTLYAEIDSIAIRFGRDPDMLYLERLDHTLDEDTVIKSLIKNRTRAEREAFLIDSLYQIQRDYQHHIIESKKIINEYQNLLHEAQSIAGKYRSELAESD